MVRHQTDASEQGARYTVVNDRRALMEEISMPLKEEIAAGRQRWGLLSFYQKFEHAVILVLTALIAVVAAFAFWNLVVKIFLSSLSPGGFVPPDFGDFLARSGVSSPFTI